MFRADFLPFTSKIVEHSRYLPVARDGGARLSQFLSIPPVAAVAKRTEPLEAVGLTDDGARPYDIDSYDG